MLRIAFGPTLNFRRYGIGCKYWYKGQSPHKAHTSCLRPPGLARKAPTMPLQDSKSLVAYHQSGYSVANPEGQMQ